MALGEIICETAYNLFIPIRTYTNDHKKEQNTEVNYNWF